ncbi:hypothetical protein BC830DRAFT_1149585 [Chytriomyces sp. MP71]|nr:hypothetical protein BC830DRAFT_1154669 [Chytriomyces sp. MP71]KAI8609635.1 hypothetical protein BC830DRAFT_1149585 [Chytriomyces sp. MP71]
MAVDSLNLFASVASIKNESETSFVDFNNVVAGLEEIRFQVDPSGDRIVMKLNPGAAETVSEEVLTSSTTGNLVLTRKEIVWSSAPLDFANPDGFEYRRSCVFKIRHSAVIRFSALELKPCPDVKNERPGRASFINLGDAAGMNVEPTGGMSSANLGGIMFGDVGKMLFSGLLKVGEKGKRHLIKKVYALVIHARYESFKFYPFFDDEIVNMMQTMMSVTGMAPFKGSDFVQSVLTQRVEVTRRQALRQLLLEESPWIDNSVDLAKIIDALISDMKPQLIVDMERLFHSCKLEAEVTKEAAALLRKAWHHSSEQSRLKILSVVDRILDRVIMRQEDSVFGTVFKWLKHLEDTVNPYRNPELLKLVLHLVRRAKLIQNEPLAPLPHDQCEATFDHWTEYSRVNEFAQELGVRLVTAPQ